MNSAIAGYIGAAIGVPLVFLLLRKGFPVLSEYEQPIRSLDDLTKEFAKWEFFTGVSLIFFTGISTYFWWIIFSKIELLDPYRFKNAIYIISSSGWAWAFPAMSAGLGCGGIFVDYELKILLKNRYQDYISYQNLKYNINTEKLGKPFLLFIGLATVLMLFLLFNWYTVFMEEEIKNNRFWSLTEEKYLYSDTTQIATAPSMTAPNGNIINRREFVVKFKEGKKWTTNLTPKDLTVNQKIEVAKFISKSAQVPIIELELLKKNEVY